MKLDMSITRRIQCGAARRAVAGALVLYTAETHTQLVAEGIETEAELETLRGLGVDWSRGYHLARPQPLPPGLTAAQV